MDFLLFYLYPKLMMNPVSDPLKSLSTEPDSSNRAFWDEQALFILIDQFFFSFII